MANKIAGLTLTIGADTTALSTALKDVNKTSRNLQSELKEVEKLLKLDPTNVELLRQKEILLADSVGNAKDKLDKLKTAAEQAVEKLARGEIGEEQFRALQREVVRAEQSLRDLEQAQDDLSHDDVDRLSDSVNNLRTNVDNAEDSTSNFSDILAGNVAANGLSAIAGAAKDAAGELADLAKQTDAASGMLQAKLGLTAEDAENLTKSARNIWKSGFGDNVTDVAESLATVRQYLGDMSDKDLEDITKKAYTISDVFGADVPESVKAVRTMMGNFGISAGEAFDIITSGYQNGLDYSGEFLDTMNEYAPQFSAMGYSAEDALNLLKNGADNGAFSLDKVADSMKEFNIRIKDGSDATAEGLSILGINYDDMSQKLADGSMTTSDAMKLVIDALQNTDDKVTQNKAGVDLFGTQWEDTTSQVILSLNDTSDAIDGVAGSTEAAADAAYDNIGAKFQETVRHLKDALEPLASVLLDIANTILKYAPEIGAVIGALGIGFIITQLGGLTGVITAITGLLPLLGSAIAAVGGPVTIIIAAVSALIVWLVHLWKTNDDFRNAVLKIWDKIKETFNEAIIAVTNKLKEFTDIGKNVVEGLWQGIIGAKDWFKKKIGEFFDLLPDWVKDILGIHSPSTVMRDEVGVYVPEGVAVGIEENMGVVKTAMQDMGGTMVNETDTIMDNLEDKIKSRADAIAGFAGVFDAVSESDITGGDLLGNLQGQVDALQQYQTDMDALVSRGVTGDLLDAIKEQGPRAAAEISALTTLTEEELNKYVELFNEKSRLAALQAQKDIAAESITIPIKVETATLATDETTAALNTAATNIVETVNTGVVDNIYKVAETAQKFAQEFLNKINKMLGDFRDMGRSMIDNITDGINDGKSGLINGIVKVLKDAVKAAKEAMDINSPSGVMREEVGNFMAQGVGVGFVDTMKKVKEQMANAIPTDFESTVNYAASKRVTSEPSTAQVGEGIVNGMSAVLAANTANNATGLPTVINVMLPNGEVLARAVFDPIRQISKQRGVAIG